MTKNIIRYATELTIAMAILLLGSSSALASEVTGNLSSVGTSVATTSESVTGIVTSNSSNGGSSSGGGNRSSLSNAPSSNVFGASLSTVQAPGFPNAGTAPGENPAGQNLWSVLVNIFWKLVSF